MFTNLFSGNYFGLLTSILISLGLCGRYYSAGGIGGTPRAPGDKFNQIR